MPLPRSCHFGSHSSLGRIRRRKVPRLKLRSRFVHTHPECVSTRREIYVRDGEARALFLKGRSRGRAQGATLKL